jgi:hypothetical protein
LAIRPRTLIGIIGIDIINGNISFPGLSHNSLIGINIIVVGVVAIMYNLLEWLLGLSQPIQDFLNLVSQLLVHGQPHRTQQD